MHSSSNSTDEALIMRLYAAHSALFAFNTIEGIMSFLERVINNIPGVDQDEIFLIDPAKKMDVLFNSRFIGQFTLKAGTFTREFFFQICQSLEKKNILVYPVKTADIFFGFIAIKAKNFKQFHIYDPVLNSFAVSVSIILDNNYQKNLLEISNNELMMHRHHLTKLVESQTASLNNANIQLANILDKTVEAIALITEQRDPYTAGHQFRVAKLAEAMATKLGLTAHEIHNVYLGALIHDIGKIRVPTEILISPAKLTSIEFDFIKIHPEAGYKIAQSVPFNQTISDIILHHHERLDGSGYPDKLTDKEIPFTTKIVTVADVFEAMSSHRPYRPKNSVLETLDELKQGAGIRYDETVVNCCIELITEDCFILPLQPYLERN
ncbi:HD-GYP domain-containing protein [Legionella bononiensis]|uniref:HD-GYP domain-containing protein n=1 Tax=Legionella bononiensis TaxID=2793102 RepID=A0ABS1WBL0_9GAMM|nr:HD-GYP domain-containing protein [Legionella bononiensis]MBL7481040.1 HD-GYP domain-containing protein [Legionella bononiensis]MBL7526748.1 HD-GYP domain-containing protein [Legionella bononiensis]MBL7564155.1 HD-GYP domain-containing protein [Legionella bononiensis]